MIKKALALLAFAVAYAMPTVAGAQPAADAGKMIQIFSQTVRTDGGNLQVIILNDRTVEAVFGASPAKAAFRSKARMTTVFFVQGKAEKEFQFDPSLSVVQKGETLQGKATAMKNFAAGKIAKGDVIQGLVELPKKLDLYEPFKLTLNGQTIDFRLNNDDVREFGNR